MVQRMKPIAHIISKRIKLRDNDIASNSPKVHLLSGELVSRQYYNAMQDSVIKFTPLKDMLPTQRQSLLNTIPNPEPPTNAEINKYPEVQ